MYSVSSRPFNTLAFRTRTPREHCTKSTNNVHKKVYNIFGAILRVRGEDDQIRYAMVQGRYTGKWSFPKGHSNPDESPYQCAVREVVEETGMRVFPDSAETISLAFAQYYVFDLDTEFPLVPEDANEIMDTRWVTLEEMCDLRLNADASEYRRRLMAAVAAVASAD